MAAAGYFCRLRKQKELVTNYDIIHFTEATNYTLVDGREGPGRDKEICILVMYGAICCNMNSFQELLLAEKLSLEDEVTRLKAKAANLEQENFGKLSAIENPKGTPGVL